MSARLSESGERAWRYLVAEKLRLVEETAQRIRRRRGRQQPLPRLTTPGEQHAAVVGRLGAVPVRQAAGEGPLRSRLQLTPAQLALLIEGIDWRRTVAPDPARRPA